MGLRKQDERTRVSIDGIYRTHDEGADPRWAWTCPACDERVTSASPAAAIKRATGHAKCCTEYGPEHNWQPEHTRRTGAGAEGGD